MEINIEIKRKKYRNKQYKINREVTMEVSMEINTVGEINEDKKENINWNKYGNN